MKKCTKCKKTKSLSDFGRCKDRKDGLNSWCRDCFHERYLKVKDVVLKKSKERYLNNKEKKKKYDVDRRKRFKDANISLFSKNKREMHYKNRYGITIEQYEQMFKSQNGRCRICEKSQEDQKKRMAVDHCHKTKVIRGLLCMECNKGLGDFKDDPDLLNKAIKYLRSEPQ